MSAHPALAIGFVAGGPGSSREWIEALKSLGRQVMESRIGVESPLAVNVVFQVPGQFLQPDFQGVRSGQFSRKERRLIVQVALPPEPEGDAVREARDWLGRAVAAAEDYAYQEGMTQSAEILPLRELLVRL